MLSIVKQQEYSETYLSGKVPSGGGINSMAESGISWRSLGASRLRSAGSAIVSGCSGIPLEVRQSLHACGSQYLHVQDLFYITGRRSRMREERRFKKSAWKHQLEEVDLCVDIVGD